MKTLTTLAATAALIALPTAAFASSTKTAENINACSTEIQQQLATKADLDFKKVKGNSRLQTLTFDIEADGEKDKVTCKVRRDASVEVVWGDDVKPATTLSVEAKDMVTADE
ncbi:MAG: hypothetical protein WBF53_03810 [Litorimonas sp.]